MLLLSVNPTALTYVSVLIYLFRLHFISKVEEIMKCDIGRQSITYNDNKFWTCWSVSVLWGFTWKGFRMFRLISRSGWIDPETESWPAKKDGRRANQPEEKQSCGTTWIINMGELINLRNNRAAELPGCLARLAQSNIFQDLKIVCQVCSPPSLGISIGSDRSSLRWYVQPLGKLWTWPNTTGPLLIAAT